MAFELILGGRIYTEKDLRSFQDRPEDPLLAFCSDWFKGGSSFRFRTSGSTGKPKTIELERDIMELSARNTLRSLPLENVRSALLCMDPKFIGGSMMAVRAMMADWKLVAVPPAGDPLETSPPQTDLISLVPMQFVHMAEDPRGIEYLEQAQCILMGGSQAGRAGILAKELKVPVFLGYGMTETSSHIALRKLNGDNASDWYSPVTGVRISLESDGRLSISGEITRNEDLITNDLAELDGRGRFRILGRADLVINSGGIKIHPEQVEALIKPHVGPEIQFIISGKHDETLGGRCVLVTDSIEPEWEHILENITFPPYHRPRQVITIDKMPLTGSQKVDRNSISRLIEDL